MNAMKLLFYSPQSYVVKVLFFSSFLCVWYLKSDLSLLRFSQSSQIILRYFHTVSLSFFAIKSLLVFAWPVLFATIILHHRIFSVFYQNHIYCSVSHQFKILSYYECISKHKQFQFSYYLLFWHNLNITIE